MKNKIKIEKKLGHFNVGTEILLKKLDCDN